MKLSKKFLEDLHKIGEDAFVEKNWWIGKLVPEIICDNLQKRGINQEDFEDCVILTVEEAKAIAFDLKFLKSFAPFVPNEVIGRIAQIEKLIEQVEKQQ